MSTSSKYMRKSKLDEIVSPAIGTWSGTDGSSCCTRPSLGSDASTASPPSGGLANAKTLAEETGEAAAGRIDGQGREKANAAVPSSEETSPPYSSERCTTPSVAPVGCSWRSPSAAREQRLLLAEEHGAVEGSSSPPVCWRLGGCDAGRRSGPERRREERESGSGIRAEEGERKKEIKGERDGIAYVCAGTCGAAHATAGEHVACPSEVAAVYCWRTGETVRQW